MSRQRSWDLAIKAIACKEELVLVLHQNRQIRIAVSIRILRMLLSSSVARKVPPAR